MVAPNPTAPPTTDRTRALARESAGRLAGLTDRDVRVRFDGLAEPVTLPAAAVRALVDTLGHLADGHDVTVAAEPDEYTVSQAARLLGVAETFLVGELDAGTLAAHGAGPARRIRRADLLAYEARDHERRLGILREMVALDEEMGLYDRDRTPADSAAQRS